MKVSLVTLALLVGHFFFPLRTASGSAPAPCCLAPQRLVGEALQDASDEEPQEMAELFVRVLDEDGEPIFKAGLYLSASQRMIEESRKAGGRGIYSSSETSDPEGEAILELEASEARQLTVSVRGLGTPSQVIEIPALKPGESHEVEVIFRTKDDTSYSARVVDDVTGEPVPGVEVQMTLGSNGFSSSATKLARSEAPSVLTDADGIFAVDAATWRTKSAILLAPGFAPGRIGIGGSEVFAGQQEPVELRLHRSASLKVLLKGDLDGDLNGARAQVQFYNGVIDLEQRGARGALSFATYEIHGVPGDTGGSFVLEGLPAEADLTLTLVRGRTELIERRIQTSAPGEVSEEVLDGTLTGPIAGVLRDESGAPIAGVELVVVSGGYGATIESYMPAVQELVTDEHGAFVIEGLNRRKYRVGQKTQRQAPMDAWLVPAVSLNLAEGGLSAPIELVRKKGHSIQGRAVGPDGKALGGSVSSTASEFSWYQNANVQSDDGTFEVGPLPAGEYKLTFRSSGEDHAESLAVVASAGAEDVLLAARRGGGVSGTVVDGATGEDMMGDVSLMRDDNGSRYYGSGSTGSDFEFKSVPEGAVHVVAEVDGFGISAVQEVRVEAGKVTSDVVLEVGPYATVVVEHANVFDASIIIASIGPYFSYHSLKDDGDRAEIALPPGPVTLEFKGADQEVIAVLTVEAKSGETVTLNAGDAKRLPVDSSSSTSPSK